MLARIVLTFAILVSALASLRAQETKPADAKTDAKTNAPAADATKPAESSPQEVAFNEQFKKWTELLGRIKQVQVDYKSAKPEDRKALHEEFDRLIKDGETLEPALKKAAEDAFAAAPNKNQQVSDVLASMAVEDYDRYRYDEAVKRAKFLIDHGFSNPRIYNLAAMAAFDGNMGEEALKLLKLADEKGMLDSTEKPMIKEQEIRIAEDKANDLPQVELKTSKGTIVLQLLENEAPNTVANFISLLDKGFYNGLTFHRVLDGFMAQGGDPKGDGTSGPGYTIACECVKPEHRLHFRGSLSMAHAGLDTGGSQFFIMFARKTHLDGKHTVFGRVIKGLDAFDSLKRRDPQGFNPPEPDKIIEAKVLRKRDHKYEPVTVAEKKP